MGVPALVPGRGRGDPVREDPGRGIAVEELDRRVARWVEAGVIGAEQGEAILALETREGVGDGPAGRRALLPSSG